MSVNPFTPETSVSEAIKRVKDNAAMFDSFVALIQEIKPSEFDIANIATDNMSFELHNIISCNNAIESLISLHDDVTYSVRGIVFNDGAGMASMDFNTIMLNNEELEDSESLDSECDDTIQEFMDRVTKASQDIHYEMVNAIAPHISRDALIESEWSVDGQYTDNGLYPRI